MKPLLHIAAMLAWGGAAAQPGIPDPGTIQNEGRAPYRTEFISYDIRKEADAAQLEGSKYFRQLTFKALPGAGAHALYQAQVDIPGLWLDREVYIRDTGRTGRYRLIVNGVEAGVNSDSYGTNDYLLTPILRAGANTIALLFSEDIPGAEMERFTPPASRTVIKNLYLFSQPRIHIFDYTATGRYDEEFRDNAIELAVVVANGFNMAEKVTVGYDVFSPEGRLVEYTFVEAVIPGRGCDTVRFLNKIMRAEKFQYSAENPALYRVVLSLGHEGRNIEYIPFRLGFALTSFDGKDVWRGGRKVAVKSVEGDFPVEKGTLEKLRSLKKQGYNTVSVTRPQQKWFYDMCEREGIYIIDRAAVECDPHGGDRGPGGTVANDPARLERFLDRQRAMFHRNRNRPGVIGWSIGSESGNGYNMYRSYRLLRSLDPSRPVLYPYAEGEWNSDILQK